MRQNMKTKISAISFATYVLFGAVFTLFFTACPIGDEGPAIYIYSLSDAKKNLRIILTEAILKTL